MYDRCSLSLSHFNGRFLCKDCNIIQYAYKTARGNPFFEGLIPLSLIKALHAHNAKFESLTAIEGCYKSSASLQSQLGKTADSPRSIFTINEIFHP